MSEISVKNPHDWHKYVRFVLSGVIKKTKKTHPEMCLCPVSRMFYGPTMGGVITQRLSFEWAAAIQGGLAFLGVS